MYSFYFYLFIPQDRFKNGHKIFPFVKNSENFENFIVAGCIIFIVEIIIYFPFIIYSIPNNEKEYPSSTIYPCYESFSSLLACVLCCCCLTCNCLCGGNNEKIYNCFSNGFRYFYKTLFYIFNIFFISFFILRIFRNSDEDIEQQRMKKIFYTILSFMIIDIFSLIHIIIFGNRTMYKRNIIFGLLGFLATYFVYKSVFDLNVYKYLFIPTSYYFVINSYFIYLIQRKFYGDFYPLYISVGYLFIFLAIPFDINRYSINTSMW